MGGDLTQGRIEDRSSVHVDARGVLRRCWATTKLELVRPAIQDPMTYDSSDALHVMHALAAHPYPLADVRADRFAAVPAK